VVADLVRTYLKNKPYTLEAMQNGIVNLSALARHTQQELEIKSYQAVKAAIRRYSLDLSKRKDNIEAKALFVLEGNRVTLLDGIRVIITDKKLDIENDAEIKMDACYVYLTRKDIGKEIAKRQGATIIGLHENCSAILLYSGKNLEQVAGVIAFLTSVFAEEGINLVELISCYNETIFVVHNDDALRMYQILSEMVH